MKNTALRISMLSLSMALTVVWDYIGVLTVPLTVFGVSGFYIGAAFFTALGFWFGMWGIMGIYFGLLISAMLTGAVQANSIFILFLSLGNVLGAMVPMFLFKKFEVDVSLKEKRGLVLYIPAVAIQSILSGIITIGGFVLLGFMPSSLFTLILSGWSIGDFIVWIIIGIPLIRGVTPFAKRTAVFVQKFWE
jgi:hypothetical protein